MNIDVSNFKFVDEENNEYIIASLTNIDNERYALMVNINDETDNFIAKLSEEKDAMALEIVTDTHLADKILENLDVI